MSRRAILIALCCGLIAATAHAQSPKLEDWSVWLYDSRNGQAWLVNSEGNVLSEQSDLPQRDGYINFFPRLGSGSDILDFPDITISTTGRYFVYGREGELYVRDTTTGEEILRYGPLTGFDTFTYSWIRRLFNEDDTLLAYGVNRSNYQTFTGGWEILIFDLTTGNITARLSDTDPAPQAEELPGFNHVPIIQKFAGSEVSFFLFPDGMESGPAYAGLTWNSKTSTITINSAYNTHSTAYFAPTGEVVFPAHDGRLENQSCKSEGCLPFGHLNTLQVYVPTLGKSFPFYHNSTLNFWGVHFIQNAEKVLTQANPIESYSSSIWHMVGRDGVLIADVTDLNIASVAGVPRGMVYTQDGSPDVLVMDTRNGLTEPTILWSDPDGNTPLIMWVSEPSVETTYPPWAQLAAP
jgi:hypothetical protein